MNLATYSMMGESSHVRRWDWVSSLALWMRTRASAARPENARVLVLESTGTILRIVRGSWSLWCVDVMWYVRLEWMDGWMDSNHSSNGDGWMDGWTKSITRKNGWKKYSNVILQCYTLPHSTIQQYDNTTNNTIQLTVQLTTIQITTQTQTHLASARL